jgi:hypothetical protein
MQTDTRYRLRSQIEHVKSMAAAVRTRRMRNGIPLDQLSALVDVTEVSRVLAFPFAL